MRFLTFSDAKTFVHSLNLKSREEWKKFCKSGKKPEDIPITPEQVYHKNWISWGDWLGSNRIANQKRQYRSFEKTKTFVHSLNLKSRKEWKEYCKLGKKPDDVPSNPAESYKNKGWVSWGDWLGTNTIAFQNKQYRPFTKAREFAHSLNLFSGSEWREYSKSGKKPPDIPSNPSGFYKDKGWVSWGDWLGTGTIASYNKTFRTFSKSRLFVQELKLPNREEWLKFCKSGKKPEDIPNDPSKTYKKEWKGWGDWLGSNRIASQERQYRSFEKARKFVLRLGLKNREEWLKFCKSGKKQEDIPSYPDAVYKEEWKGWGDWVGTGIIAATQKKFKPFLEAKSEIHKLGFKGKEEWYYYCKSGKKPPDIPANPAFTYGEEWTDWPDWLGYEEVNWSVKKTKMLLRDLIASGIIYQWKEAVLYSLLLRKGVLNLENNKHKQFFRNLIYARQEPEGKQKIEEYAYSNLNEPPDLSKFSKISLEQDNEQIGIISSEELSQITNDGALDYGEPEDVEQILKNTEILESINVDEEAIQFYVNYSIKELWRSAFTDEITTMEKIEKQGKNGNKYHDIVIDTFLSDYDGTKDLANSINRLKSYNFPHPPTLMQRYVAYKMKVSPFFGNFSGTGAGKTLSAVLSSRIVRSKLTLIICPKDVINQWKKNILEIFPDSDVVTHKEAFYATRNDKKYTYLIPNYDQFSLEETPNLILNLGRQEIEFVVLDEIHFVKKRDKNSSLRRRNLEGFLTIIRKKNPKVKILGLSATPVINNLNEGKSLLELMTGKVYDDISISPTIPNAVALYEKLSTVSIRELPNYGIDIKTHPIEIFTEKPTDISIKQLKRNPLSIEQYLTDSRIKYILEQISGQTIIYTEYITNVIKKIIDAVRNAGFSFALYTGSDRSGLSNFLDKKIQVLIASKPISTGVDGLQEICNRLIVNTLPWTNAQYQQLLGRLVRKGQIKDVVNVYLIKASIAGYPYDQLKWNRIEFKKTLADCVIDGVLPEKNLITPQQAAMEAVRWLERLERGEISTVVRQDLNVELTQVQIEHRITKYGDFSRLNKKFNSENSLTTNKRLNENPEEWREYHRQYREARKTWTIIPYEEIINRIEQLSPRLQIADFGCGEAKVMEKFGADRVYSFDHIGINDAVIACDMKKVPIPDDSIDIAVFSLSLMGKNWIDYLREAKRCLATNEYLFIAETTKSLLRDGGRLHKLRDTLKELGFEIYVDIEKGDFTFIEARNI